MLSEKTLKPCLKNIKKCILFLCLVLISCVFIGCGTSEVIDTETQSGNKSYSDSHENDGLSISYISVCTAEQNDNNVWEVMWPNQIRKDSFQNFGNKLENAKQELSKEEAEYFINYIESIEMMDSVNKHVSDISKEDYEGHQYLGSVKIAYSEDGKKNQITRYIFDEYPAGYSDFINKFGEICGENLIPLDYNMQDLTVKYFRRMARIGLDVPDDIIEEFLNITECDMFLLLENYNHFAAQSGIEFINTYRHLPKEILSKASDENELKEYVIEVADKFDISESGIHELGDNGYYFSTRYGSFDIYPSNKYPYPEYIAELKLESTNVHFYNIQDYNGPEGMIYANYFVYSEDGKFMVIIPAENSKGVNEIIKTIFDE